MAYADLPFYKKEYFGNVVPDNDFPRLADRASDYIDRLTFDRLAEGLPDNERWKNRIKKAVCAVAEKLYQFELAEKQALSAAAGGSCVIAGGITDTTGVIVSKSSGSESISYASPSELSGSAKSWSAVYRAAGDEQATNKILTDTARLYLAGIETNEGVPLLYAGVR